MMLNEGPIFDPHKIMSQNHFKAELLNLKPKYKPRLLVQESFFLLTDMKEQVLVLLPAFLCENKLEFN